MGSHEINMKINKISTYKLSIKIKSKKQALNIIQIQGFTSNNTRLIENKRIS